MLPRLNQLRLKMIIDHIAYNQGQLRTLGNIDFHQYPNLLKVVLNRPKALNSLNLPMIRDLSSSVASFNQYPVVWMEGAGEKSFCAGGDVKELFTSEATIEDRLTFFREEFTLDYKLTQLKALQIVNWDGIVMGGGFGISAFAPFRIATENTVFAMPEGKLGFFTDVASSFILSRLRNYIGYYLGMTGARLKGEEVYIAGLANYFIPRSKISETFEEIRSALSTGPTENTRQLIEVILNKHHQPPLSQTLKHQSLINQIFSGPFLYIILKKLEQLETKEQFAKEVKQLLKSQCPLSVGVIHRLIGWAQNQSVRQSFLQDFRLIEHYVKDANFAEGVRCVLKEKGATPTWSIQEYSDVDEESIDPYFFRVENSKDLDI